MHALSNETLVKALETNEIIKHEAVAKAMLHCERRRYCLSYSSNARDEDGREGNEERLWYRDRPLPIGFNATISAPHMHALCLNFAYEHFLKNSNCYSSSRRRTSKEEEDDDDDDDEEEITILDIGCGSGYLLGCFSALIPNKKTKVIGIEHIEELVDRAIENLIKDKKKDLLDRGLIEVIKGDGRDGYEKGSRKYDLIHVGACAKELPQKLIDQLKAPGRLIIPCVKNNSEDNTDDDEDPNNRSQSLLVVDKHENGTIVVKNEMDVMYVPLTDEKSQLVLN
jgi:protein-L-isoaspartate(D-aspartate) O-methyltransferase